MRKNFYACAHVRFIFPPQQTMFAAYLKHEFPELVYMDDIENKYTTNELIDEIIRARKSREVKLHENDLPLFVQWLLFDCSPGKEVIVPFDLFDELKLNRNVVMNIIDMDLVFSMPLCSDKITDLSMYSLMYCADNIHNKNTLASPTIPDFMVCMADNQLTFKKKTEIAKWNINGYQYLDIIRNNIFYLCQCRIYCIGKKP